MNAMLCARDGFRQLPALKTMPGFPVSLEILEVQ